MTTPSTATAGSLLILVAAAGLAASPAQARPRPRHHAPHAPDPRDARIAELERKVDLLAGKVEALQADLAARPPAPPAVAAVAPPTPPPVQLAQAQPPAPPAPAPPAPAQFPAAGGATITAGKPLIASADGRFTANIHGVMQFDSADYLQDKAGSVATDLRRGAAAGDTAHARDLSSGSNFRRSRIGIEGKAFGDFDYYLLYEFGGAGEEDAGHIQETWIQYSGLKPFHARIGAFPPSVGLEDQASTNGALFLERPAVADIARSVAGGDFREGAEIWGGTSRWYVSGAVTGRTVGVVNSQATGVTQPYDAPIGLVGRFALVPWSGDEGMIEIGVHGSHVARTADTGGPDTAPGAVRYGVAMQERPELRVDGTRLISTGSINAQHAGAIGLEAAGQYGPFFLQGEYERLSIQRRGAAAGVSDPHFIGYYVEGSWIATGERRRFNPGTFAFDAPPVDHPFSLANGTWGAFEVAGRYSLIDLNYHEGAPGFAPGADAVRGGEQRIITGGLNWYPNTFVRFALDIQDVHIDRLSPSAATFGTPAGAQVGQDYQTISLRSQFAF
jgi:phosphate-selective porin OprO/OprP